MSPTPAPTIPLVHGAAIPHLGLGTFPMDDAESETAIARAIEIGYRLIDTACQYGNETGVGRGARAGRVPREELFITTKLNLESHGYAEAQDAFAASAERLGVDEIDLLLIHWPNPAEDRYVDAWRGMVKLLEDGHLRAIGVSNFKPAHLERLLQETGVAPDVNQIQLSPALAREDARAHHAEHGIVTESYSPIGGQGGDLFAEPAIAAVAARHDRTPAQVVLRWHLELGLVPIPKTSDPDRMAENLDVFSFSLSEDEVRAISALDRGEGAATDSDRYGH